MLTAFPEELQGQADELAVRRLLRFLPILALFVLGMGTLLHFLPEHFRFAHPMQQWSFRIDEALLFRIYKAELVAFGLWMLVTWGACRFVLNRPAFHRTTLNVVHGLFLVQCGFSVIIEQQQGMGGIFDVAIGCFVVPSIFAVSERRFRWTTVVFLACVCVPLALFTEDLVRFLAFAVKSVFLAGLAMLLQHRIHVIGRQVYRMIQELQERNAELAQKASCDPLTGLANRRAFDSRYQEEWARARRYRQHFSVVSMDIDFFKRINDTYGHDAGDRVLSAVGGLLRSGSRPSDYAARMGGEEFLLLLPGTSVEEAKVVAERLREGMAMLELGEELRSPVTASFGVATSEEIEDPDGEHSLLRLADRRLYAAKHNGRNRVVCPLVYSFGMS
jgi:diguanylate cyclase (GGDEF)-like protein